jgi:hypothetical protein
MRYSALLLLFCSLSLPATFAQEPGATEPTVTKFDCPKYPSKAESMGLQGAVMMEVTTDGHRVTNVKVTSGHPVLVQAAEKNVQTWEFADSPPTTFSVTYFFINLNDSKKEPASSGATTKCSAKMELPNKVTVTTRAPVPNR